MLGVGRNGAQRLCGSAEQNAVDDLLILKGNSRDRLRHSEDHMEILGIEQLGSTIIQPLGASQRLAFWTVAITAGNGELTITCLMGKFRNGELERSWTGDWQRFQ
jgi:hypothetical protein